MPDGRCRMGDEKCRDETGQPRFPGAKKWVAPAVTLVPAEGGERVASGTEGGDMELIEERQNKANCLGVCHYQIRTYDERVWNPARALAAAETPGISTFLYQTPVQYR